MSENKYYYIFDLDSILDDCFEGPFDTVEECIKHAEEQDYSENYQNIYVHRDDLPIMDFVLQMFKRMFNIKEFSEYNIDYDDAWEDLDVDGGTLTEESLNDIENEVDKIQYDKVEELEKRLKQVFLDFCKENKFFDWNLIGNVWQTFENKNFKKKK
jgi:hypothetical protein